MKKTAIQLLFVLFTLSSYSAHKDKFIAATFGNVKTLTKTGFYGYGLTEKVKITGLLAQKLCLKLSYKDTIVIEFCHDYTSFYDKMIMVENGNSASNFLIGYGVEDIESEQKKSHSEIKGKTAVCIRIIDAEIAIKKIIKLIEYCILNRFENNTINLHCKSSLYFETKEMVDITYLGMPDELINKALNSNDSPIINDVLNEKVSFFNLDGIDGYYQNGNYRFTTGKITYEIKDLLYLVLLDYGVCVFETNDSFVYLSENIEQIKKHKAKIKGNSTYITSRFSLLEKNRTLLENENVMLYKYTSRNGIIFSEKKNEIIRVVNKYK
ncbi:hypothetical protein [Flavobacterium sp.]|uniref:hypothetical protein n=1 Tax=Flavobacterium sp. TaxID=239 RepID=UPI003D6BF4C2